ncbi:60S ribosomal protein L24 (nucleomorph) [Chroomonas mesostigmatica CCMP1168]|uniref:60S ribosomal protein L24 n=1 Tax=Chroomonas mesostigmatica CCMP1168 TaxID=1195612 RepID=J7G249_9CRYP|nr:60S ribosomal protein L24 [Chroomonas mesostigmatica CCMP1168]|mmetsp:Transcript_14034/g.34288  ORF Transcript_14034/g.34288 Transcript_14034/m.34288 type:complete len:123 (-) Transcript_14034:691-1059(-)
MEKEFDFCSLCSSRIYPGHGSMYVKNNLNRFKFCRSKCSKLFHLKKNPFFLRWTIFGRRSRGLNIIKKDKVYTKSKFHFDQSKAYNSRLIFQTFYRLKRRERTDYNRKFDFKILKKKKNTEK